MASLRQASAVLAAIAGALGATLPGTVATAAPPLSSFVVSSVPGFNVASSGPLSAHRFASYDPDPAAVTAALGRLTVEGGFDSYLRTWAGQGSGTSLGDVVVAFATPALAKTFVSAAEASLPAGTRLGADSVPGVPGVSGVSYPSPYLTPATERVVLFTVSRAAVIIGATEPGETSAEVAGPMATLALEQRHLLAASPFGAAPTAWWHERTIGVVAVALAVVVVVLAVLVVRRGRRPGRSPRPGGGRVPPGLPVPAAGAVAGPAPAGASPPTEAQARPLPVPGTPPGWLPDPGAGGQRIRYWDGTAWTAHTAVRARADPGSSPPTGRPAPGPPHA